MGFFINNWHILFSKTDSINLKQQPTTITAKSYQYLSEKNIWNDAFGNSYQLPGSGFFEKRP